jgi:hypothetical protein
VTVSIAGLVNEVAPPLGAKLKAVAIEAPAVGNIQTTTAGLGTGETGAITGTGVDFVALGVVAGMRFKMSASAVAANNGWYRALNVTTTRIGCDQVPAGFATDTAAAVQIRLWLPDYLRDGTATVVWYDFERSMPDLAVAEFDTFPSMVPSVYSLSLTPRGLLGGTMEFVGANFANVATTRPGGSPTDVTLDALGAIPRTGDPFDTSSNVAQVTEAGAVLPAVIRQLDLSLANGLSGREVVGQLGFSGFHRGILAPTATLRSYYASNSLRAKLLNDTASGLAAVLTDPNGTRAFIIDYPSGKFTEGNLEGIQISGQRELPLTFQAQEHTGFSCAVQLFRFAEYG